MAKHPGIPAPKSYCHNLNVTEMLQILPGLRLVEATLLTWPTSGSRSAAEGDDVMSSSDATLPLLARSLSLRSAKQDKVDEMEGGIIRLLLQVCLMCSSRTGNICRC